MSGSLGAPLVSNTSVLEREASIGSDTDSVIRIGTGITPENSPIKVDDKPPSFRIQNIFGTSGVGIASTIVLNASSAVQTVASKAVTRIIGKKQKIHSNVS